MTIDLRCWSFQSRQSKESSENDYDAENIEPKKPLLKKASKKATRLKKGVSEDSDLEIVDVMPGDPKAKVPRKSPRKPKPRVNRFVSSSSEEDENVVC